MKVVIVESPTKAKTISRFLTKDFLVESSNGHVRDLPKSELGIDIENNFEPKYVTPKRAQKKVSELKKIFKKADSIILATDEDREGEAIAWHLASLLPEKQIPQRIVFHEITKKAVEEALKNPREIDTNLVEAQQARRILDRLVGYKLSPLLWKKLMRGLSAGRVQSVALRLIVEREEEIRAFKSIPFWTISAFLNKKGNKKISWENLLVKINSKTIEKPGITDKKETESIINELKKDSCLWRIESIEKKTEAKIDLNEGIFNVPVKADLIAQYLRVYFADQREGNASVKTKGEVSGGGRKPWRQKGTGRARHGSIRSPIWKGGGVTFGPTKDVKFEKKIGKKMAHRALFVALSEKARGGNIVVVDSVVLDAPKTKEVAAILKLFTGKLGGLGSVLMVLPSTNKDIQRASGNIQKLGIVEARNLNSLEVLSCKNLILIKDSINVLEKR